MTEADARPLAPIPAGVDPSLAQQDLYRPERVRAQLGFGLVALTVAFVALQVARGYWEQTREFAEIMLPAEVALLGSALTFYFTAQRER